MGASAYNRSKGAYEPFSTVRRITQLTTRDRLWLTELSHGATTKELSESASWQAAKNRMQSIRHFLNVATTTQAVAEAIRRGIIR